VREATDNPVDHRFNEIITPDNYESIIDRASKPRDVLEQADYLIVAIARQTKSLGAKTSPNFPNTLYPWIARAWLHNWSELDQLNAELARNGLLDYDGSIRGAEGDPEFGRDFAYRLTRKGWEHWRDLQRVRSPGDHVFDRKRSVGASEGSSSMLSTFISYGGPDEAFARQLNQALNDNGVETFFYPLDAELGQRNSSVMHRKIKEHDRVVLICSEASLTRPGVQTELTEVMDEEALRGGDTCLIPIRLDDYVLSEGFMPKNPDHRDLIVTRVVGDFRGADKDESKFKAALPRLVDALRK
jgi:hypothetical protein